MSDLCPVAVGQDLRTNEQQPETAGESHLLLLKQKKYCDVIFTFPNLPDRIAAHEIYLKARSPVFEHIFRMRKSGNVQGNKLEISDTTPDIFQQFLEFIYADKLEADIARALDLLQLGQKYKVHSLTKKCEELLKTEIPIEDLVKAFETARRYGRRELMDRAGLIMVKSFAKLVRTGALASAEEETFVFLLNCDDLSVKEVQLFEIILKWGKPQIGTTADKEILRQKLNNLISKIRFTNMAPEEFTKVVVPTGLLSAEETISVYSYFCGDEVTRKDLKIKFNTTCRQGEKDLAAIFPKQLLYGAAAGYSDLVVSSSSNCTAPCKPAPAGGAISVKETAAPRSPAEVNLPPRVLQINAGGHSQILESATNWRCRVSKPNAHLFTPMQQIIKEKPALIRPKPHVGIVFGCPTRGGSGFQGTRRAMCGRDDALRDRFCDDKSRERSWRDDRPDRDHGFRDHQRNIGDPNQVINQGLDRRGGPSGP